MGNNSIKILSGLSMAFLAQLALAGTITDVSATNIDANNKLVTITFSGGATLPQGFITDSPNRISLDFRNTDLNLARNSLTINDNVLRAITVASDKKRARVALDLNVQSVYKTQLKGDRVEVYVSRARGAAEPVAAKQTTPKIEVETGVNKPVVTERAGKVFDYNMDVKFVNQGGGARIEVNLPEDHQPPKVNVSNNLLTVTFPGIGLSNRSIKKYDVDSFRTAVRMIEINSIGNDAQMVLKLRTGWQHMVSDLGNKYAVVINNKGEFFTDLDEKKAKKVFTGKRLTLDFENVDVRTILSILAKESGMNIIAADGVKGAMTLHLKDVPWDQALDLVLESQDLEKRQNGNLMNIAPRAVFDRLDQDKMEQQRRQRENGPLFTRTYQLQYKSVEDFKQMLQSVQSGRSQSGGNVNTILSDKGSLLFDKGTNTLVLTDIAPVLGKFERLVTQMDVPVKQVLVESKIVEVSQNFIRNLGLTMGGTYMQQNNGTFQGVGGFDSGKPYAWEPSIDTSKAGEGGGDGLVKGKSGITLEFPIAPNVNLPVSAVGGLSYVIARGTQLLNLQLMAMEEVNDGKIISSPRVLTQDRRTARIEEGRQVPYITGSEDGKTKVSFANATTLLEVTPQITPDGNVIMDISVKKDSVAGYVAGQPELTIKQVQTKAMVENGGTMVVGGIYVEEQNNNVSKIPFLGDLPLVGNLFKSRTRNHNQREMLIFITPRIMDTIDTSRLNY